MSDEPRDRLFDGPPSRDEEVERLERLLRPLGTGGERALRPAARRWPMSLAAGLLLAGALGLLLLPRLRPSDWAAQALAGRPLLGGEPLGDELREVRAGQWLETGEGERIGLELGLLGRVELAPGSRLQVASSAGSERRLRLEHGSLRARTLMPPRWFSVETPAGEAVDLGCAFALSTDAAGRGRLEVDEGQVSFAGAGRQAFVPAGGACLFDPERGPGTPIRRRAAPAFRRALERLDREGVSPGALEPVLRLAEPADGLSLWHLLARTEGPARARVHDRLAELCPPPARVGREEVLRLELGALARWQWPLRQAWQDEPAGGPESGAASTGS